ncbi:MAG: hypothetical protein AAF085_06055, partial [Planctomycetota bacterium]
GRFGAHKDHMALTVLIPLTSPSDFHGGGTGFWSPRDATTDGAEPAAPPTEVLRPTPIAITQRDDAEVVLVLARHAAKAGRLEQLLTYSDALKQAKAPQALIDFNFVTAASRRGYAAASADRLDRVIEAMTQDADDGQAARPVSVRVELDVLRETLPQLRVELGDRLLQAGEQARAAKAYTDADIQDPTARHALVARQVYLALLAGDQEQAIDRTIALLGEDEASPLDAGLVSYLITQGVPANAMAPKIDGLLAQAGSTLPRLEALSRVATKAVLLQRVEAWLGQSSVTPGRLVQAVSLFTFDDQMPADAKPMAELLKLIAASIEENPPRALVHARAAVETIDAPVTMLRAIRSGALNADQGWSHRMVSAASYEATGRRRDALTEYATLLLDAEQPIADQALLPVVRLQLLLGMNEQAHALLGQPDLDASWTRFELSLRAMAAAGKAREALTLVDGRIKTNGKQLFSDALRLELIAMMGQPQEACNLLLRLISSNPNELSLYSLGLRLAFDYSAFFSRQSDAARMSRAFQTRLISNLPESSLARIAMAQNIMGNPARLDEAKAMLFAVLEQEPDNGSALSLLVEIYDEEGDTAQAAVMHDRYVQALSPGMSKALVIAERSVAQGQPEDAVEALEAALKFDEQGVLPGRAMTGDQASRVLRYLEAAEPDRDTDDLYLAMVRRFPNHSGLNNALGYRWTVQNKNLLQAQAMIERALQEDPANHSLLDSLAWVQYKLGDFAEAKTTQARALMVLEALLARLRGPGLLLDDEIQEEFAATTAILNDHMGDIFYKLGDQAEALSHWREAMKQEYGEEQMRFDPELRSLEDRLEAKIDALATQKPVPVAEVPGKEAHGPAGHPADQPEEGEAPAEQ